MTPSEEVRVTNETGGMKGKKPVMLHPLPWEALQELGKLYRFGAEKYADDDAGPYNFRRGYDWSLSYDSMLRHMMQWWNGETIDEESGLSHMAHAAWHALTLLLFEKNFPQLDDRHIGFPSFHGEAIGRKITDVARTT